MKYANCGASVKSSGKVKKMNTGGFMKIGDGLQKLDVNKTDDKVKANKGKAVKKTAKRNEPSRNVKSPKAPKRQVRFQQRRSPPTIEFQNCQ